VLNERQFKDRIDIQTECNKQLKLVHAGAVKIQEERIKQHQGRLDIAQSRKDKLIVKAGFDGVLQKLSVELGQSLSVGQEVEDTTYWKEHFTEHCELYPIEGGHFYVDNNKDKVLDLINQIVQSA
jgi:hypothetical protein